jgi:hypothetical protein
VVSSLKEVGLASLPADNGRGGFGDEFSIAAAYAFDKVLNAVGDEGSMSAFRAVTDFPRTCGVVGALICNDNRGLFGGDEGDVLSDILNDEHVLVGASIIES